MVITKNPCALAGTAEVPADAALTMLMAVNVSVLASVMPPATESVADAMIPLCTIRAPESIVDPRTCKILLGVDVAIPTNPDPVTVIRSTALPAVLVVAT